MNAAQQYDAREEEIALTSIKEILKEGYDGGILTEEMINQIGYDMLTKNMIDIAIEVFKFNVERFPNSYLTYDSLGEAYMEKENYGLAIDNFNKSLEINSHNKNALDKINEIQKNR